LHWSAFINPIVEEQKRLFYLKKHASTTIKLFLNYCSNLKGIKDPLKKELLIAARKILRLIVNESKADLA
jgi:hypothetical protein